MSARRIATKRARDPAPHEELRITGRHRGPTQFLRFVVAAGLSVPVNLGTRILFSRALPYEAALVLSHLCGMLTAYALTRLFVFERSGRSARSELARFAAVNVVSVVQTWIIAVGLVRLVFPAIGFERQPELIGHVIGLAAASVTSYIGHRHYSFGKR
jgi:putative flippase GtrA